MNTRYPSGLVAAAFVTFVTVAWPGAASAQDWNSVVWNADPSNAKVFTTMREINHTAARLGNPLASDDRDMVFQEPYKASKLQHKLVVVLHGVNDANDSLTGLFTDFQKLTASHGFHSIVLDYDYGHHPDGKGEKASGPGEVCGCWSECHGIWAQMVAAGGKHVDTIDDPKQKHDSDVVGIPPSHYPVKDRLRDVLQYLEGKDVRYNHGWHQFLDGDNVRWDRVVLVGFSRGSIVATWIAKHHRLDRLLVFSGPWDNLIHAKAYGLPPLIFPAWPFPLSNWSTPGADPALYPEIHPGDDETSWGYKSGSFCTPQVASPGFIADNDFTDHGGGATHWATRLDSDTHGKIFSFNNNVDDNAPFYGPLGQGTAKNLQTLGLPRLGAGPWFVGDRDTEYARWDDVDSHDLVAQGDICTLAKETGEHHTSTLVGTCTNNEGSSGTALRQKVWTYMLTH